MISKAMLAWKQHHLQSKVKSLEKAHKINLANQLEDLSHKYNKEIDMQNQRLDEA